MEINNALGRRKTAVARVYLTAGTGAMTVNKKDYKTYFPTLSLQIAANKAFEVTNTVGQFDTTIHVDGGGTTGQALVKLSATNYDTAWSAVSGGGGAHASTHAAAGADPVTLSPSQITGTAVITTDSRLSDARTPTDGSVTDLKIATTLSPSKITGTAVVTADARLSDTRVPTDASVTDAKIASTLSPSKVTGTAAVTGTGNDQLILHAQVFGG